MQMKTIKNTKYAQESTKFSGKRNMEGKPAAKMRQKGTTAGQVREQEERAGIKYLPP